MLFSLILLISLLLGNRLSWYAFEDGNGHLVKLILAVEIQGTGRRIRVFMAGLLIIAEDYIFIIGIRCLSISRASSKVLISFFQRECR